MTQYKIDKDVPLPSAAHGNAKYPFAQLKVGDSFFVEGLPSAARVAAYNSSKRLGITLVSRREGTGYRIWRAA